MAAHTRKFLFVLALAGGCSCPDATPTRDARTTPEVRAAVLSWCSGFEELLHGSRASNTTARPLRESDLDVSPRRPDGALISKPLTAGARRRVE